MSEATDIVAIDGPAGAGKSSVARRVAERLGFAFLDTGAMYRAATWWALHQGIDLEDGAALAESTASMALSLRELDGRQEVLVAGEDITEAIRSPEVTRRIFHLDQNSAVRRHLVVLQRAFGEQQPTVAEGRDIGTVVFPKAKAKIYLDADPEERARRRAAQLAEKGAVVDLAALVAAMRERDEKAQQRADSPLRRAEDAWPLDTTGLSFEAVVEGIVGYARERLGVC